MIVAKLLSRDVAFVGAPTTQRVPFILAELGGEDPLRRLFRRKRAQGSWPMLGDVGWGVSGKGSI